MLELRLHEASPAWTLEQDFLVGFDLSYTTGLRLAGLDTGCEPDESLQALSDRLAGALSRLPDGALVRFVSLTTGSYASVLASYRNALGADPTAAYIAFKKSEQCRKGLAARRRELFAFASTPPAFTFNSLNPRLLGRRAAKLRARAAELDAVKRTDAARLRELLATGLQGTGIEARPLDQAALFETLWRLANPGHAGELGAPAYRPDYSLRSQLFENGLANRLDYFERGGQLHRVLTLRFPPRQVVPTQIAELQALPFEHMLVVTLRRLSDADATRRVETARRQGHELNRVLAKVRGAERHAEMPDAHLVQQRGDAEDVVARLARSEKLFDVAIQLWFAAPDLEELDRRTETALARFRATGQAEGAVEELRARFAFLSMLPGHQALIGDRYHPMLASRAADLLPVYEPGHGAENPIAILTTRAGELVGFHPFARDLPAWNATVAGGTGSGKSFTTRTLLTGWLASGGRLVVATRGRDYHRYASVFGGAVFDISLEDPALALGPFPSVGAVAQAKAPQEALEHLAAVLEVMVAPPGRELDRLGRRLIFKATQAVYATGSAPRHTPAFAEWVEALQRVAEEDTESRVLGADLLRQLRFWLDGPYAAAFGRSREAALPPFSVWNLEAIRDADTQGVVLALLSSQIAQSIQAGPTVVVLDEVWAILKSPAGAALVEVLYRTVRKAGSAIWTISQSMSDFTALPDAVRSAVLNNSPIKLFLAHDASEVASVASTFRLNERETQLLASLRSVPGQFSELLTFMGSRRQLLRLTPTGIEYWLATSHPRDTEWEALARQANPDVSRSELLKKLARRYPHGAVNLQLHVNAA